MSKPQFLPDTAFSVGDGRPIRLSRFRGKAILLNVWWATWRPRCREEMPSLNRLEAKLGGPEFEIVALSIDRDGLSAVKLFYLQTGIEQLRVYVDSSGQAQSDPGVQEIPTTLLVDRAGLEIGRKVGPAEWDSPELVKMIRSYLAVPVPAPVRQNGADIPR